MGITQHRNAVATIKEFVNVALLRGKIGRPGAGLCPVRGHSNVQGDRTMGIWEKAPDHFLDALRDEYGFEPPREHGLDTVDAIRALRDGKAQVLHGHGRQLRLGRARHRRHRGRRWSSAELTVMVSTKLNRSHVRCGRTALILPALGRSERDRTGGDRPAGHRGGLDVGSVHASRGPLRPAGQHLRSEVDIVCRMAEATLGTDGPVPWADYRSDYTEHPATRSPTSCPGCASYDEKVSRPGGSCCRTRHATTGRSRPRPGKAIFTPSPMDVLHVPEGRLLLQRLRSHDQFNTTIYGLDDRYRGVSQRPSRRLRAPRRHPRARVRRR